MKRKMNVLSIDWDYLVDATMKQRNNMFPDGGNEKISRELGNIIWTNYYLDSKLKEMTFDKEAYGLIKKVINKKCKQAMICNSHQHIYNFILKHKPFYNGINIVNIDFHHDCYKNGYPKIDCGNWMFGIMDLFKDKGIYTWISRIDSDMNNCPSELVITQDLDIITSYEWDYIYMCRSDMWSPPHLDSRFNKLYQDLIRNVETIIEKGIEESRYNNKFIKCVEDYSKMLNTFRK